MEQEQEQEPLVVMFNLNNTNLTPEDYFILESVIGYTSNALIFCMMIPQIYKAYKSKLTDDISYKFIWISLVSTILEIAYGILINQIPVLLTGIICMIQMILLYIAKKLYDNPKDIKTQRRLSVANSNSNSNSIEIIDLPKTQTQTQTKTQIQTQIQIQNNIKTWEISDGFLTYTFSGPSNLNEIAMSTDITLYDMVKCININIETTSN